MLSEGKRHGLAGSGISQVFSQAKHFENVVQLLRRPETRAEPQVADCPVMKADYRIETLFECQRNGAETLVVELQFTRCPAGEIRCIHAVVRPKTVYSIRIKEIGGVVHICTATERR